MECLLVAIVAAKLKLQSTSLANPAGSECHSCQQPLGCDGRGECEGAASFVRRRDGLVTPGDGQGNCDLSAATGGPLQPTFVAASRLPSAPPATKVSQQAIGKPKISFNKSNKIKFCDPRQE